jgi:heme-degrading monooxygenase HmoA
MYARVVTGQCQSTEKLDEAFQMYRDSIVPAAMQAQGFKGALGLVDRSTGKVIAISLRETAADMQATESSGFLQEQFAKLIHLLAETPIVEVYEVSIQEMQQGVVGTYDRVLTSTAQLSKMDEGVQIVRDSISLTYKQQPGFKGGLWLSERRTGKITSITLWATEADMLAGESSGYFQAQIAKFAHVLASPVVREAYEVALQV